MEGENSKQKVKLNSSTVILVLLILLPLVYLVVHKKESKQVVEANELNKPADSASTVLEEAIKNANNNPSFDAYFNLGNIYYSSNKFRECISANEKALTYNPQSALAYNNIGAAYGALQEFDSEIVACKKALAIDSTMQLAKNNLNWALSQVNKK